MAALRSLQTELNHFLYSSELAYGFTATTPDARLVSDEVSVADALSDVYASAWFPSARGRMKYTVPVRDFRAHLQDNHRHVSRAIIVMWYAHFEDYLGRRVRTMANESRGWGPFTRSLASSGLQDAAQVPLPVAHVLNADLIRVVRNMIAHGTTALPDSQAHPRIAAWISDRTADLSRYWNAENAPQTVRDAADYVLGRAVEQRNEAVASGRRENLEHFYTLFALTNLDALAVSIEEALIARVDDVAGRINRAANQVRRPDLVVEAVK